MKGVRAYTHISLYKTRTDARHRLAFDSKDTWPACVWGKNAVAAGRGTVGNGERETEDLFTIYTPLMLIARIMFLKLSSGGEGG